MVRVIAGSARGRKLKTLDSENTKPTLDRVKEAMFSMIMTELPGARVLDLFSGNGSLGIEALSRGAASCVFNDCSKDCCGIIRENVKTVGFSDRAEVVCNDYVATVNTLSRSKKTFDLILLDPPYRTGMIRGALEALTAKNLCEKAGNGVFGRSTVAVCEHGADEEAPDAAAGFRKIKTKTYGTVAVSLYNFVGE